MSSNEISDDAEIYVVKTGDTLSAIAHEHGTTTTHLLDLNSIHLRNGLIVGQRLTVRNKRECSVVPLFIDLDRNPIQGLRYRLESADGTTCEGVSQLNGLGERFISKAQGDKVRISVQRPDGTWKAIHEVEARVGEKLVTLRSGKLKISLRTEPHPMTPDGVPVKDDPPKTPPTPSAPGTPKTAIGTLLHPVAEGHHLGLKALPGTTPQGAPVTVISKDRPDLRRYFARYTGEAITAQDWSDAARDIRCETAVIKAFAHVESRGAAFDKLHRPAILYERHVFSKHTQHQFDGANADISAQKAYTRAKVDQQQHAIADSDRFGTEGDHQYQRFEKAYLLNPDAAIQACSWG